MADLASLTANAVEVLPVGDLERRLARARDERRPLRVKLGIDPTAPVVTLGHAVVLTTLRAFQDAGHQAVLIVGDYTARVGDPSGRSKARPMLTPEEIEHNVQVQLAEYGLVLDLERAEVRRNSEWLEPLGTAGLLELAARTTVARLLERDDFAKRLAAHEAISLQELLYPLLQGYDSVAIRADVELGGTDQKFTLLMGRDLQESFGQAPQIVFTLPLLVGTDGVQKMSKSLGNFVGLRDEPNVMYGRVMSLSDEAMPDWFRLASGLPSARSAELLGELEAGELAPVEAKRLLARTVVERFHGAASARAAEEEFLRVHRRRELPSEIAEAALPADDPVYLPGLLVATLGISSNSEARRLIEGGGVRLEGEPVAGLELPRAELEGRVMQVGRRRFVRFVQG
ncbi:MAG: tyrosine--tRNA ligase [Gaiellaceae bacterium]